MCRLEVGSVNRVAAVHECAAGKAVNVAVAAHALGEESLVLTTLGGMAGQRLAEDLATLGVRSRVVPVGTPTRVCTTLLTESGATELVEPAGSMTEQETERFVQEFADLREPAVVVLSGSLASGVPSLLYARLARRARGPVVIDACGPELLAALETAPLVVKPSKTELERTLECTLDRESELHDAMVHLAARGARWVVVSHGGDALWVLGHGVLYRAWPSKIRVVNPIGSGDCLAAGIACGILRGLAMLDAIRLGMACAAANAATLLPARIDRDQCTALAERVLMEIWDDRRKLQPSPR